MLYLRMILYALFSGLAVVGAGVQFDADTMTVTIQLDDFLNWAMAGGGVVGYVSTFWAGRISKENGGAT